MTTTTEPLTGEPAAATAADVPAGGATPCPLDRAAGIELIGAVNGSGYRDGAALVRREDGQTVQLGPLMYAVLDAVDGQRDLDEIAAVASATLGRTLGQPALRQLVQKLAEQGLLAGTEAAAPPRRNPLLALRWRVLVTNPRITRAITGPFTPLFRPWIMWPTVAAFAAVCWFVLVKHGIAGATSQAMNHPGLLLLVFLLTVFSAGVHEIGHAAACRYGGATPGGMGAGLYLVWPAFYTDVTDAYRLDRRGRLRVDLAGLYFNAFVAVLTMVVWLFVRVDALLLLAALQLLQMAKQLSPMIRADGYHILADATGVPDLYAHLGPTLRRLLPGHRHEPSALTGKARALVTIWVLAIVPILFAMMLGAVLVLPRIVTTAWDSGHHIVSAMVHGPGGPVQVIAGLLRLLALALPVVGSTLVTQSLVRNAVRKGRAWSAGSASRRAVASAAGLAVVAGVAWAWWPAGQYQPVRPTDRGTLGSLVALLGSPQTVRQAGVQPRVGLALPTGRRLAVSAVPVGGPTATHPALILVPGSRGQRPIALLTTSGTSGTSGTNGSGLTTSTDGSTTVTSGGVSTSPKTVDAAAFPFSLPQQPGPHDTQALALGAKDGGAVYDIAYSLVTVTNGAPVDESNSAYALAHCQACTTVAVAFQVVLVIGQSDKIMPVDVAEALNSDCPSCQTTAIADQIVVSLKAQPSKQLERRLETALRSLDALVALGANGNPADISAAVAGVQGQIDQMLQDSGLLARPLPTASPAATSGSPAPTDSAAPVTSGGSGSPSTTSPSAVPTQPVTSGAPTAGSPSPSPSSSASASSSTGASSAAP